MSFLVGSKTDIGQKRSQNQDNFLSLPDLGLFAVADGMGGHKGGEIASLMAVEMMSESIKNTQSSSQWKPIPAIIDAICDANEAIFERSLREITLRGMGTTTTALLFKGDQLTIGHVGDSRCYYFDLGNTDSSPCIWQLTRDHSLVQEKVRAGVMTRAEAENHQMKNVITRSVGFEENLNVEIYEKKIFPGDTFLICSDGLSGLVNDLQLLKLVQKYLVDERNIEKTTEKLIEEANRNGGDDNITAVLIQYY